MVLLCGHCSGSVTQGYGTWRGEGPRSVCQLIFEHPKATGVLGDGWAEAGGCPSCEDQLWDRCMDADSRWHLKEGGGHDKEASDGAFDVGDCESTNSDQLTGCGHEGWKVSRLPPKGWPGIWRCMEALPPEHRGEKIQELHGSRRHLRVHK